MAAVTHNPAKETENLIDVLRPISGVKNSCFCCCCFLFGALRESLYGTAAVPRGPVCMYHSAVAKTVTFGESARRNPSDY